MAPGAEASVLLGAGVGVEESPRLDGNGGLLGTVFAGGGGLWGIALFGASTVDLTSLSPKALHSSSASSFLLVQKS